MIDIKKKYFKYKIKINKLKGGHLDDDEDEDDDDDEFYEALENIGDENQADLSIDKPIDLSGLDNLENCYKKNQLIYLNEIKTESFFHEKLIKFFSEIEQKSESENEMLNRLNFVKYKNNILSNKLLYIKNIKLCMDLSDVVYKMNSDDTFKIPKYKYIDTENSLIIICKGTTPSSYSDIKTDFTTGYTTNYHKGMFNNAMKILFRTNFNKNYLQKINLPLSAENSTNSHICSNLFELIKKYNNNEKKSIILTGHSLGAGTCIYILIILMFEGIITLKSKNIQLYLYGSPPVIPKILSGIISKFIINIRNYADPFTFASISLINPCYTLYLLENSKNLILYNCIIDKGSEHKKMSRPGVTTLHFPHLQKAYIKILAQINDIILKNPELEFNEEFHDPINESIYHKSHLELKPTLQRSNTLPNPDLLQLKSSKLLKAHSQPLSNEPPHSSQQYYNPLPPY